MKKYNKKMLAMASCIMLLMSGFLQAKVRAVRARRDFEQTVSKNGMVVVLFYEDHKGDKNIRSQNKGLTRMYEDLSIYQPYNDADVIFLKVNTRRKELVELTSLYNVATMPTFMFFNKGKRLVDDQGAAIALEGFVSRADLQACVDKHYGEEITRYVTDKKNRRNQIAQEENESWKPYFYPRDVFVRDYDPVQSKKNME